MKKIFFSLVLLFSMSTLFSQKTIDKPEYSLCNLPGELTKIELTAEATILHFHIKYPSGQWISIPKQTYIQDTKGGEKLFITKAEGIPLVKKYTMPETGEVQYQLYFPKLDNTVNTIDYGEANKEGTWMIYDIVINEQETSILPKELKGNWLLADGSNQWDYGFYNKNAIVDKAIWNYKSVEKEKKYFVIVLERNGKQRTVYAQIDKKKGTSFGSDKLQMKRYSTTKTEKPDYKLPNDELYSEMVFKRDSTTYSGVIKGYSTRTKIKTGAVHVDNVFTGEQETYVVKIADDGSFSVKFPINHPQSIWVRLPYFNSDVFVEPSKETFQLIVGENTLFMGDCARVNTDLKTLGRQSYEEYDKLRKNIFQTSPEEYKNACLSIKNKEIENLNQAIKKQFISQKAIQIKKLDIEFMAYEQILSYDMFRESAKRNKSSKTTQPENKTEQDYKLEASYYDFITESVLNDQIAVIGIDYSIFINRLKYAHILRSRFSTMSYNSTAEIAEQLQKSGVVLTKDELEMVTESKKLDSSRSKFADFYNTNASKFGTFIEKYKEDYARLSKEKPKTHVPVSDLAASLQAQGISLSAEENELVQLYKSSLPTKEEEQHKKAFAAKYGKIAEAFFEKYQKNMKEITNDLNYKKSRDKIKEVFGVNDAFVFDIFTLQDNSQEFERNSIPYSDSQLNGIQSKIKHPFLSNYIVLENDRLKAKLESNKTKTDFTVNTVKKTEGDELFESMITKFKGKVIYVDFWATWCGPCMSGIKEIAHLKEEMKNENVVFLYITNQTSPENTWNAKIPDIKGEHYRVSEDEWNYLSQKFNISGIPHYVLVNKKGEIVNPKLGHRPNEELKAIFEKEMK